MDCLDLLHIVRGATLQLPLPGSAQWFAPLSGLLPFITGAQSQLQPGNGAHTEPQPPLRSSRFNLFERFSSPSVVNFSGWLAGLYRSFYPLLYLLDSNLY
ncbi:hypothetical protein PAMA_010142 [Pampus argenteus]